MIDIEADIESVISESNFAQTVTFTNPADEDFELEILADFREPSDEVLIGGQVAVEAQKPSLECQTSLVEGIVKAKFRCTVDGNEYQVERLQNTGVGISVIYLRTV